MILKIILIAIMVIHTIFDFILRSIAIKHRELPLPEEVSDIYSEERFQKFKAYKKDYLFPGIFQSLLSLIVDIVIIVSPFYSLMERLGRNNIYLIFIVTLLITSLIEEIVNLPFDYYATFVIEEKYGKNKKTPLIFFKDECLGFVSNLVIMCVIVLPLTALVLHLIHHTALTSFTLTNSILFTLILAVGIGVVMLIAMGLSYIVLNIQYKFTDLEDGELKDKIIYLMRDSKKKVKHIKVYNESKKSTGKNAFLLKMLWYREFGIADNFINENDEDELLAVLSHEIGHLKHKKNIYNYLRYIFISMLLIVLIVVLTHLPFFNKLYIYFLQAFSIKTLNILLLGEVIVTLLRPVMRMLSIFNNYVSRKEEYEADDNAVKEGYGEALIQTFKTLSSDELVDVNPAPIIEFIEFDHPGMYNRIHHIHQQIQEKNLNKEETYGQNNIQTYSHKS